MNSGRATPIAVFAGLGVMLGVGVWLLCSTPGSLVNEQLSRLGPTPGPGGDYVTVQIDEGDGAIDAGKKLEAAGVIESAGQFRVLAALMGVGDHLAPGSYEFTRGETALDAIRRINQGLTAAHVVTIPEGLRVEEVARLLEQRGVMREDEFLSALGDQYGESFLAALPPDSGLEGFLFPATYGLAHNGGGHATVQQMLDAFDQRYREEIQPRLGSRSLLDIVTLASIIEREAQVPAERPVIASVFLNRLAAGFPLQADPTVQFAVASDLESVAQYGWWKPELSQADLDLDSPYNTYTRAGLPPGPIANPGLDSLLAALEPASTSYLFFVARPDGSHAFATTLEEHQRNVCEIDPTRPEC